MRLKIEIPDYIHVPKGSFKSAFCKGAMAAHEGKKIDDNPYLNSGGAFGTGYRYQWIRGFHCVSDGQVRVVSSPQGGRE